MPSALLRQYLECLVAFRLSSLWRWLGVPGKQPSEAYRGHTNSSCGSLRQATQADLFDTEDVVETNTCEDLLQSAPEFEEREHGRLLTLKMIYAQPMPNCLHL